MNYFYINFEIDELITVQKVKDACDAAADCSNELISEADDQWNYFDDSIKILVMKNKIRLDHWPLLMGLVIFIKFFYKIH